MRKLGQGSIMKHVVNNIAQGCGGRGQVKGLAIRGVRIERAGFSLIETCSLLWQLSDMVFKGFGVKG